LPGRVLQARVESIGWGVGEGDLDPTTGLPKTHQNTGGWLASAQRFPVQLAFEADDGPPRGLRYNARASVILYTGEHPVFNARSWLWLGVIGVLPFAPGEGRAPRGAAPRFRRTAGGGGGHGGGGAAPRVSGRVFCTVSRRQAAPATPA